MKFKKFKNSISIFFKNRIINFLYTSINKTEIDDLKVYFITFGLSVDNLYKNNYIECIATCKEDVIQICNNIFSSSKNRYSMVYEADQFEKAILPYNLQLAGQLYIKTLTDYILTIKH